MDITTSLQALEQLSSSTSTSSSGPLKLLLDEHFENAKSRLISGQDPKTVITDLQKAVIKSKKDVEKGLKAWYSALGNVGKQVDKAFPPYLAAISEAYDHPPLFSSHEAASSLDKVILESLGRRGLWEAVQAMEEDTGLVYDPAKRELSTQLHQIISDIENNNLAPAIEWCTGNSEFLQSPPHPSSLPYYLHRQVFLNLDTAENKLEYARKHLMPYVPTQPVLQLITSSLYPQSSTSKEETINGTNGTNGTNTNGEAKIYASPYTNEQVPLIELFTSEFCRLHSWSKEDPLEVVVDLGSSGGALNVIEKARRVMGERLGPVRTWQELPMEVPLPPNRRYHSVFVCPVSKDQATESNPPTMLACGHVIAQESFNRLLKGGRRSAKCPYCPVETSVQVAQRLYF